MSKYFAWQVHNLIVRVICINRRVFTRGFARRHRSPLNKSRRFSLNNFYLQAGLHEIFNTRMSIQKNAKKYVLGDDSPEMETASASLLVVHLAASVRIVQQRSRSISPILHHVHFLVDDICHVCRAAGESVRTLRVWQRYSRSKRTHLI